MSVLSERLSRMLALVPYFVAHPGTTVTTAANEFGVSTRTLIKDLNQLWMCGLPGHAGGDLIELIFDSDRDCDPTSDTLHGRAMNRERAHHIDNLDDSPEDSWDDDVIDENTRVSIAFAAGIDRPLRVTSAEATPILIALRILQDAPGAADPEAITRALSKLENVVHPTNLSVDITPTAQRKASLTGLIRDAITQEHAIDMRYYSASRDSISHRVVDPIRIRDIDGHTYLRAWCRTSQGFRLFRFDRIDDAKISDHQRHIPIADTDTLDVDDWSQGGELFDERATIEVAANALWMLDYHAITPLSPRNEDGTVRAEMVYGSREWMVRFLLGNSVELTPVSPTQMSDEVRRKAHQALAAYRTAGL